MAERRGRRKKSVNTKKGEGVRAGRPRDQLADEAILRAASDLFGEYGIEGATVEQIATRAGVARTTVYRRWSSREDIIVQAIESARNFPEQIMDGFEELQPDELVHLVLKISLDALTRLQFRKLTMRLIGSSLSHPALTSAYQRKYLQPRRSAFVKILEKARVQGLLPQDTNVEILCDMLSGAMLNYLLFVPEEHSDGRVRTYLLNLPPSSPSQRDPAASYVLIPDT